MSIADITEVKPLNLQRCEVDFNWLEENNRKKIAREFGISDKKFLLLAYHFEYFRERVATLPAYLFSSLSTTNIPVIFHYFPTRGESYSREFLKACASWLKCRDTEIYDALIDYSKDRFNLKHPIPPLGAFDYEFLFQVEQIIQRIDDDHRNLLPPEIDYLNTSTQELIVNDELGESTHDDPRYLLMDDQYVHNLDHNLTVLKDYLKSCERGKTIGFIPLDLRLPYKRNREVFEELWKRLTEDIYEYSLEDAAGFEALRKTNRDPGKDSHLLKRLRQLGSVRVLRFLRVFWKDRVTKESDDRFRWKDDSGNPIQTFPKFVYFNCSKFSNVKEGFSLDFHVEDVWTKLIGSEIEKTSREVEIAERLEEMYPFGSAHIALKKWNEKTKEVTDLTFEELEAARKMKFSWNSGTLDF